MVYSNATAETGSSFLREIVILASGLIVASYFVFAQPEEVQMVQPTQGNRQQLSRVQTCYDDVNGDGLNDVTLLNTFYGTRVTRLRQLDGTLEGGPLEEAVLVCTSAEQ